MSIGSSRISLVLIAGILFLGPAGNLGAGDAGPPPGTYRILGPTPGVPPNEASRESVANEVKQQRRGERGRVEMPVWLADPGMKPHVHDLYAYLKARSDGAIGTGPPLPGPLPPGERE